MLFVFATAGPRQTDYEKARQFYAEGKNKEAKELCDLILTKDPRNPQVLNTRGCALHRLGDFKAAVADFKLSLTSDPKNALVHANLGRALRELRDYKAAIQAFDESIRLDPKPVITYCDRGATRRLDGDYEGALKDGDMAVAIEAGFFRGHALRADALYDLKKYAECLTAIDGALKLNPKAAEMHHLKASSLRRLERFDDALKAIDEAIGLGRKTGSSVNERGLILMASKRYSEALKEFDAALTLMPNNGVIIGNRGRCHFLAGDTNQALRDLDAALAINPKDGLLLRYRAEAREKVGDIPGAKADLTNSLIHRPQDEKTLEMSARLGVSAGNALPGGFGGPTDGICVLPKDPQDEKQWPTGDQLWKAPEGPRLTPPLIPPVQIPPTMEFGALPPALYSWAITTAKEGMRAVMGPMTADEESRYEAKWAAYYETPTPEVVAYVNSLNPLLAKFLEARSGFVLSAQESNRALVEAGLLSNSGLGGQAAISLDASRYYKTLMDGYESAMKAALLEIEKLGPMPNPFEARRKRAKRLNDEIALLKKAPEKATGGTAKKKFFVLQKIESSASPADKQSLTHAEGRITANAIIGSKSKITVSATATWPPLPRVVPYTSAVGAHTVKLTANANVKLEGFTEAEIEGFDLKRRHGIAISLGDSPDGGQTWGSATAHAERSSGTSDADLGRALYSNVEGGGPYNIPSAGAKSFVYISASSSSGSVVYLYRYVLAEITDDEAEAIKAKAEKEMAGLKQEQEAAAQQGEMEAAKMARIAFLKDTRDAFIRDKGRVQSELLSAPESSRKELAMQAMYADAMAQSSIDALNYAETGQWKRTRTLYDDYDLNRMMEISADEARRASLPLKVIKAVEAQIQLAPDSMRADLRERLNKGMTPELIRSKDEKAMRALANGIAADVSGYWTKEGEKESWRATLYGVAEEGTKIGAGVVILGAGSVYVAGYGVSATTLWAADTLMGAAYGGTTGYVEGGPDEACRRSLQWAGLVGFATSEAIDSYGQGEGGSGVFIAAGRAVALGKAFEAAGKFSAGFFKGKPTVQESFAIAKFEQELKWGQALLARSQRAETAMAEAVSKKLTGSALQAAERELAEVTAAVNGSYHAKLLLKYGDDATAAAGFIKRVESLYERVQPDFLDNLRAMGYDVANLKFAPIRNASSAGSVGMDLDLRLLESAGLSIRKKGQVIAMKQFGDDAQTAYNRAYFKHTGYSAEQSLVNVTTSAHREAFTSRMAEQKIPFESITANDRSRAAEVLLAKTREMPLTGMTKAVEAARATEKELRNRVLPDLTAQIAKATAKGDKAAVQKLQASHAYWQEIRAKLERASQCEKDPYKMWQAMDEVKAMTGGKDIFGVAEALGYFWKGT